MTDLLFRRVLKSRAGADGPEDYDVAGPDGLVVGRIFKASTSPVGTPWMWTVSYGFHEDHTPTHGYKPTREAAMAAFAKKVRTLTYDENGHRRTLSIEWRDPATAANWANQLVAQVNAEMRARAIASTNASLRYLRKKGLEARPPSTRARRSTD